MEEENTCNPIHKTCPYMQQSSYIAQDMYQQQMTGESMLTQTYQSMGYLSERDEEYIPAISYGHGSVSSDFWYGDGPYYPNYYYGEYPYPYANYPYYPLHPPYSKRY